MTAAAIVALALGTPVGSPNDSEVLEKLLPGTPEAERAEAFEAARTSGDERYLAPLTDLLRHAATPEEWFAVLDAAGGILEEDLRAVERPWRRLTLQLAEKNELASFEGYARWKGELLARLVDPRFREFLHEGVAARIGLHEVVWGGVRVDGIPALDRARVMSTLEADYLDATEPVFGVYLGGEARAYPLRILDWHEMANDVIGGVPVSLAYCTLCGAGVLFRTGEDEARYTFGSSGLLMRSNKLMYDRETKSLWNQLTGEPVVGPLATSGERLEVLPLVLTTWDAWRERHPATSVLDPATGFDRDYTVGAAYGDYFSSDETWFPVYGPRESGQLGKTGALGDKARIFVVRSAADRAAFPLEELRGAIVLNGEVGDAPIVVHMARDERQRAREEEYRAALSEDSALPGALRGEIATRRLAAEVRAFERGDHTFAPGPSAGLLLDETGRQWRITERALESSDGAESLPRVAGHLAYAFAWRGPLRDTHEEPRSGSDAPSDVRTGERTGERTGKR